MVFSQAIFLPNSKARGVDGRGLRLRKHHIAVFDTGHRANSPSQEPTQRDVESWPCVKQVSRVGEVDFNLRHATWRWLDPIEIELPKRIVVLSHRTLSMKTWMTTPGCLTTHVVNICRFFMRKVVLRSMGFVVTSPAIFKPIDKRSDVQEQQILHL